jgi:hypothetical protein
MMTNRKDQDIYTQCEFGTDWVLVEEVKKDICLLYHTLRRYGFIMGDLNYSEVYSMRYWRFLDMTGLPDDGRRFIRDGCLVMILAMCWEVIDGSGSYLIKYLDECTSRVSKLVPEDEDSIKLLDTVIAALTAGLTTRS